MKAIYNALKAQIEARVPEIKEIAVWNNQLRNMGQEQPIADVAVYIDLVPQPINYSQAMGDGQEHGEAVFEFHLVTSTFNDNDDANWSKTDETNPLLFLELIEKLNAALLGFGFSDIEDGGKYAFSSLIHRQTRTDTNHSSLREDVLSYETHITDVSASRLADMQPGVEYINVEGVDVVEP